MKQFTKLRVLNLQLWYWRSMGPLLTIIYQRLMLRYRYFGGLYDSNSCNYASSAKLQMMQDSLRLTFKITLNTDPGFLRLCCTKTNLWPWVLKLTANNLLGKIGCCTSLEKTYFIKIYTSWHKIRCDPWHTWLPCGSVPRL
jgi:hypothetical protein